MHWTIWIFLWILAVCGVIYAFRRIAEENAAIDAIFDAIDKDSRVIESDEFEEKNGKT